MCNCNCQYEAPDAQECEPVSVSNYKVHISIAFTVQVAALGAAFTCGAQCKRGSRNPTPKGKGRLGQPSFLGHGTAVDSSS